MTAAKTYFAALLHPFTGFDAAPGHCFCAKHLFGIAEETLRTQMSGMHIIRSRDQFAINAPSNVFRKPQL